MSARKTFADLAKTKISLLALAWALPVSFLGAPALADTGNEANASGQTVSELVVKGQRLSSANSIQQQKSALGVVNVISADDMGKLPDANVADALARVPGINVVVNQETGEGEYVSVRGLAGTFNAYAINGVRVALTDSGSRKASLTVLPPNGLKSISVSKTLTPDMDGDAIGGTVNFVTPSAFDFKKPTIRVFASYGMNDRAEKQGEKDNKTMLQIDGARRFGTDGQFGVFVSAYYDKSYYHNEETENDGEWEPYKWRADSKEQIDARSMYLPGIDLDYRRGSQERFGGNFSLDFRNQDHELYLRGQYAELKRRGTNDYTDFRSRKSERLGQVDKNATDLQSPDKMITGFDAKKGNVYGYTTKQIIDADGDNLITDNDRFTHYRYKDDKGNIVYSRSKPSDDRSFDTLNPESKSYWSLNGRSGVWNPKTFQFARSWETQNQDSNLMTLNFGGISRFDRLKLEYDLSYSRGEKGTPSYYSIGYNCDACSAPLNQTGLLWSSFDPRFPMPQLPAFAANVEHDPSLLPFDGASKNKDKQTDARLALKLDATYKMDGVIEHVKAGLKYMRSDRKYDYTPIWGGEIKNSALDGKNLAQSGLIDREVKSILAGRYYYGAILNPGKVMAALDAAQKLNPTTYSAADLLSNDKKGAETILAGYGLAKMRFGQVEVVAGARVEQTEVENHAWVDDGAKSGFGKTSKTYTNVLPSVTAVYRPSQDFVYRGAVWTSFSRPEYGNILRGESVTRNPKGEVTGISRGNPDLKPASAVNIDLSAEYYPDRTSLVMVGLFHKSIDNFIFTNGSAVDAPTSAGTVEITQPKNGQNAKITGIELSLIKSFQGMPEPFDGFGVEANLTYQKSSAETGLDYRKGRSISFIQAPTVIYNTALTYQKYGFEAKLSYQYQGAYIEDLRDNAVDKWVQPNKALDLHTRYNINPNLSVDFDVQNILDGHRYYTTKGKSPSYQKDYMEPGRNYVLRLNYVY